jgi:GDPmannose 4,6-dehydratase
MSEERTVVITGITGQDGSYLAELLLSKGYNVHGIVRRLSKPNFSNIQDIIDQITLHEGDLHDQASLNLVMRKVKPDEVYNLASQSFVGASWSQSVLTGEVTGLGALRVFESVRAECPDAKVYQAGSSEMFGKTDAPIQHELTPFHPRSPYGAAKVFAHHIAVNFRESYEMFISNGVLYNHESPRRGIEFVTKKTAVGVARIACTNDKSPIQLGNIYAQRDWGYAPEYVEAMWKILQLEKPIDLVIATGKTHTVKSFLNKAFNVAGIEPSPDNWRKYVEYGTPQNIRPADVIYLCGDSSKAKQVIDWEPKVDFERLVEIMVEHEMQALK